MIKSDSTTPALIRLRFQHSLIHATPPNQVFHPDIERSEIVGKGSF
jgi:hypothetical protein